MSSRQYRSRWNFSRIRSMSLSELQYVYEDYNLSVRGCGLAKGCRLELGDHQPSVDTWLFTSSNISNLLMVSENKFWDATTGPPQSAPDNLYILLQKSKWGLDNPCGVYGWHCKISSISADFQPIQWWGDERLNTRSEFEKAFEALKLQQQQSFEDILKNLN